MEHVLGVLVVITAGPVHPSTLDERLEHDLIIGTFGRAAYVLDDIRPLRALAAEGTEVLNKHLHVFQPPTAVLAIRRQASGTRFNANAMFSGENRDGGAMLSFIFNPPKNERGDKSEPNKREGKGRGKRDDQPKKDKADFST